MDAYGNLTRVDEFFARSLRLISYLDPDVALGVFPPDDDSLGAHCVRVHRLSSGDPDRSVLMAYSAGPVAFSLSPGNDLSQYLTWQTGNNGLMLLQPMPDPGNGQLVFAPPFELDFVQGCWFALNNADHSCVVDVSESGTAQRNPIIPFEWNGGANQIWRAQAL